jgi:hypothetical protein
MRTLSYDNQTAPSGLGSKQIQPEREVECLFKRLEGCLDQLSKTISLVNVKIQPILRSEPEVPANSAKDVQSYLTPLGKRLGANCDTLCAQINALAQIADLVEL